MGHYVTMCSDETSHIETFATTIFTLCKYSGHIHESLKEHVAT